MLDLIIHTLSFLMFSFMYVEWVARDRTNAVIRFLLFITAGMNAIAIFNQLGYIIKV